MQLTVGVCWGGNVRLLGSGLAQGIAAEQRAVPRGKYDRYKVIIENDLDTVLELLEKVAIGFYSTALFTQAGILSTLSAVIAVVVLYK